MLAAIRTQLRPAARTLRPLPRTLHTTTRVFAGHAAPSLLGEGAKPGEVPTDENQSTGLERLEILGKLEGVDVFDMNPLEMTRMGTLSDPIKIYSLVRRNFSHYLLLIPYPGFVGPRAPCRMHWLSRRLARHDLAHRQPDTQEPPVPRVWLR
ncbi:Cytochrome c oxidase subunit 4 [Ceratobasidium sp. UAMH 11750]|nr:Cytochrome c oxidase subunit 4 [Ceratobasidium sp. UAMH 11750]